MSARKKDVPIHVEIADEEQWLEALSNPTLFVVDVYQEWCGPCKAVESLFRKLRTENGDDLVRFGVVEASSISDLTIFKGKCQPVFLLYLEGKLVSVVKGVNGPLLQRTIMGYIEKQKKKQELGSKYKMNVKEIFLKDYQDSRPPKKTILEESKDTDDVDSYHVVIIKPDAVAEGQVETIKKKAVDAGYCVVADEERILNEKEIRDFYKDRADEPDFLMLMSSGPVHALILKKGEHMDDGGPPALTEMIDPSQVDLIRPKNRSKDGQEVILEVCGDSSELASRQLGFFFPSFDFATGTMRKNDSRIQRTFALLRPSLVKEKKNEILQAVHDAGFQVAIQKEITLSEEQAREFYKEHEGKDYFQSFIKHMTSGPVLALALTREDAVQHWRNLLGPKILEEAKEKCPDSLRAQFAIDDVPVNQLHGSSTMEEAQKELQHFFPVEHTLAVIKPDAAQQHKNDIISCIESAGFSISQVKEAQLTKEMAENFYKHHHDKSFFNPLVDFMSQGPSVLMILSKENAISEWREMMGPVDPEKAKEVSPNSLRARFAKSVMENAVHGSSDSEHAMDNIRFIFGDVCL
ncbi:thioredoxin domain-containing protein 6-like [Alosa sapidissima]|uniref:thioredoxin domain-containing protein 6-like n=1 Tax=Alosa sapidissima TaxID=34773 RepID=UPI001C09B029|nr:thioredoxin domain-containing protein 6-like [Alosa sapidissima]